MDGNSQEPQTPQQPNHPLSFLQGMEWTGGGILLGIVFFLSVFLILNYFNILRLSSLYPNQLGFLPHRPYQTKTQEIRKQPNISSVMSSSASVDTLKQLNTAAQRIVDTILNSDYRENISLEERKIKIGDEVLPIPTFVDPWETKGVSVTVSAQYDFNVRRILNIDLSMFIAPIDQAVSSASSSQILSRYLVIPPKMQLTCETSPANLTQCNGIILRADESKLGISLRTGTQDLSGNQRDIISICQFFSGSSRYSWSSCIHK